MSVDIKFQLIEFYTENIFEKVAEEDYEYDNNNFDSEDEDSEPESDNDSDEEKGSFSTWKFTKC